MTKKKWGRREPWPASTQPSKPQAKQEHKRNTSSCKTFCCYDFFDCLLFLLMLMLVLMLEMTYHLNEKAWWTSYPCESHSLTHTQYSKFITGKEQAIYFVATVADCNQQLQIKQQISTDKKPKRSPRGPGGETGLTKQQGSLLKQPSCWALACCADKLLRKAPKIN